MTRRVVVNALGVIVSCGLLFGPMATNEAIAQEAPIKIQAGQPGSLPKLYSEARCDQAPIKAPSVGQVFDYQLLKPDGSLDTFALMSQTIRGVTQDRIDTWEQLVFAGSADLPEELPGEPRQMQFIVLPTVLADNRIVYDYGSAAFHGLLPGQSAEMPVSITHTPSISPPRQATATLTFVGCGVSEAVIPAAPNEPVRVYRVRRPEMAGEARGDHDMNFVVSAARGWPIAMWDEAGVLVLTAAKN